MRQRFARFMLQFMRPARMRSFKSLMQYQWRAPEEIQRGSHGKLTNMLRHACLAVPFYRDFAAAHQLQPDNFGPEDVFRFPVLKKTTIIDNHDQFLNDQAPPDQFLPNSTGGSTGVLFRFFNDRNTIAARRANDLRGRTWSGWQVGDAQAILWGHPRDNQEAKSKRARFLAKYVHRTLTLNSFDLTDREVARFCDSLATFQPSLILGYASSLDFLATYISNTGQSVDSPLGLISSAETLLPEHRENIEKAFSCDLLNRYGSREFGVIAQQCRPDGGLHVFSDQVHLEILDPGGKPCAPGELGEIVITDLANFVMPLIRYRTGDMARSMNGQCSCGRGFPLLAGVEGRTSEIIVGKNGRSYSCPGPRFYSGNITGIGQMQLIQDSLEEIQVKIVPTPDWSHDSEQQVVARMQDLLGSVAVHVEIVGTIPPAPSGKFPFAISRVSPFK